MGMGSCCRGFGGFSGPVRGFPWIWRVVLFVRFGFGGGVLIRVEFGWVGCGGGRLVEGRWWSLV